jgi:hypothetical protein
VRTLTPLSASTRSTLVEHRLPAGWTVLSRHDLHQLCLVMLACQVRECLLIDECSGWIQLLSNDPDDEKIAAVAVG